MRVQVLAPGDPFADWIGESAEEGEDAGDQVARR
jgi:hypothetical protein